MLWEFLEFWNYCELLLNYLEQIIEWRCFDDPQVSFHYPKPDTDWSVQTETTGFFFASLVSMLSP